MDWDGSDQYIQFILSSLIVSSLIELNNIKTLCFTNVTFSTFAIFASASSTTTNSTSKLEPCKFK